MLDPLDLTLPSALAAGADGPACDRGAADARRPDHAAILASIGEVAYEWVIETDALVWGANAAEVLGLGEPQEIASGRAYAQLLMPDNAVTRFDAVMGSGKQDTGRGVPYQIQYALRGANGEPLWVEDTGRWFADAHGRPLLAYGVVRAVNEKRAQEQHLAYLSRFDELTGEMNRGHLSEVLAGTVAQALGERGSCGFLLVGIDNLARVNEAYGFEVADEVIGAVAGRLRSKLRAGDALGRFSGNKFGVVLKNCSADEMSTAAERLITGVRDDVLRTSAGPVPVTVTASGIAAPRHARSAEDIFARAQETLDRAKRKQPGSFLAYRPCVEHEALRRENARVTDEIVTALNERRILLAFEPVVSTATRVPAYHEALVRVRTADGGLVAAGTVIPAAERLGLVRLIDCRVLELVVEELRAVPDLRLSFNVSPASTLDPEWWGRIEAELRGTPAVAGRLTIEITEMAEIADLNETRGFVSRAKDLGCRIALDDFGAGFTSFRNLRKLGVDIIKIDGSFVQHLTRSADDRAFVRTLLELCRGLGVTTVAEWVQDEEAAAMLGEWGCDCLQGALIGLASVEPPWTRPQQRRGLAGG